MRSVMTAQTAPAPRSLFRWIVMGVVGMLLVLLVAFAAMLYRMNYVPADLDLSTTLPTAQGLFHVHYTPNQEPIAINKLHSWTIRVTDANGEPIADAVIGVDGDMPQHGHGLPTRPQVTRYLGNDEYLVEGMKFQMGGWWVVDFTIDAAGQHDTVRFNMLLK